LLNELILQTSIITEDFTSITVGITVEVEGELNVVKNGNRRKIKE